MPGARRRPDPSLVPSYTPWAPAISKNSWVRLRRDKTGPPRQACPSPQIPVRPISRIRLISRICPPRPGQPLVTAPRPKINPSRPTILPRWTSASRVSCLPCSPRSLRSKPPHKWRPIAIRTHRPPARSLPNSQSPIRKPVAVRSRRAGTLPRGRSERSSSRSRRRSFRVGHGGS